MVGPGGGQGRASRRKGGLNDRKQASLNPGQRRQLVQRPRRRSNLPEWDEASVSAVGLGQWNKEPSDASPSPLYLWVMACSPRPPHALFISRTPF